MSSDDLSCVGSPPLARGAPLRHRNPDPVHRIIPACAGRTVISTSCGTHRRNHPRLRGEYYNSVATSLPPRGSLPLGREVPCLYRHRGPHERITPARAGSTDLLPCRFCICQDHPRSRGEHEIGLAVVVPHLGSPPLARGVPGNIIRHKRNDGITPARAGSTLNNPSKIVSSFQ